MYNVQCTYYIYKIYIECKYGVSLILQEYAIICIYYHNIMTKIDENALKKPFYPFFLSHQMFFLKIVLVKSVFTKSVGQI